MQNTAIMVFPDTEEVAPRYDQKSFDIENQINTFVNVVSPKDQNDGNALWVYQKLFFHIEYLTPIATQHIRFKF
jgi:hypothetical protein